MVKKLKLQSCLDLFREEAATRLFDGNIYVSHDDA